MSPELADVGGRRTVQPALEEHARDRAREHQVGHLGDHGDGRETRVHAEIESSGALSFLDRLPEPLEEAGGEVPDRRFRVCRLPVDQFSREQEREVGVGREDGDLALDDAGDDVLWFRRWSDPRPGLGLDRINLGDAADRVVQRLDALYATAPDPHDNMAV